MKKLLQYCYSLALVLAMMCTTHMVHAQAPQASITITSPKSGDVVMYTDLSTRVDVQTEGDLFYPVVYEYTTNGGADWVNIQTEKYHGKAYIASFFWDVPDIEAPQAQIRITDSLGTTGLSGIFRIRAVPKILTLTVNHGKFPVPVDKDVLVEWTASGDPSPFDIDYVVNGFAHYEIAFQYDSTKRSLLWHTPETPVGNVVVRVQAYYGGAKQVGPFEVNIVSSVDEAAREESAISVYPNPAATTLTVRSNDASNMLITLTDNTGKQLLQQHASSSAELDLSSLAVGSYMLTVQRGNDVRTHTVIVQR